MFHRPLALFLLLGAAGIVGAADEPKKPAGPAYPQKGSFIPGPFHVLNLTGESRGRYHCLVCENGLNPVAAVFVRPAVSENKDDPLGEWLKNMDVGKPLPTLMKKLDTVANQNQDVHMAVFSVFMLPDAVKEPLLKKLEGLAAASAFKQIVLTLAITDDRVGKESSLKDWNLDPKAEIIVILYSNHMLTAEPFVFTSEKPMTDKDVAAIVAAYEKIIPPFAKKFDNGKLRQRKR